MSTYPQPNINPQGTFSIGAQFAMGGTVYTVGGSFVGSRDNGFYINGVNANDNYIGSISFAPSAEAIGTGTIQITDFSAAIGHDISAINIQTKGGGNKFHGEGYDFLENTDLNAFNPWSNALQIITGSPTAKPILIRNQFGGNMGGPIPIPGFKNRLFFFVNYENFIEHDGNQELAASVPSAAERMGDFSELLCGTPACDGNGTNPSPIQLYNPFMTTYDPSTGISSRPPLNGNRLDLAGGNGFGSNLEQAFSASGGNLGYEGGDGMADLVLGTPSLLWERYVINGAPTTTAPVYNILFPYWGFYGNDKFRISPKLTISAGLRYDLSIPDYTPKPSIAPCCAIYTPTSDGGVLEYPGIATGLPEHYLSAPKRDFAPRLSIAYSPDLKTVIRAGYGIFYDTGANVISNNLGNAAYGTSAAVNYNVDNTTLGEPVDTPFLNLSNIFPTPATTTLGSFPVSTGPGQGYAGVGQYSSITYYDQKSTPLPYIQRMLFDVQRQVATHDVFTLSYVGAQGRKGQNEENINLPPYQTGWPFGGGVDPTYNAARPNNVGRFGDIYVMRPMINSFYNALVAQYRHDFSRSFQFQSSYTWGKTVGDYPFVNNLVANGVVSGGAIGGFQYPNLNDRGESNQSHRHRFASSGIWSPEYGKTWPAWARLPLTGWRLAGILTLESGEALTVTNGGPGTPCPASDAGTATCPTGFGSSAQDGAGFDEVFVSGNPNLSHGQKSFSHQFNTAAFSVPPQNVPGDSGFGAVRGPGQNRADISLAKTFPLYETVHLEFRADAFNAFNHTNWNGVNTTYPSGNTQFPFGQVNGANEARIVQVAAKVVF